MNNSKIVLGSAQFGMDYGVTNIDGQSSIECVEAIVELAISHNIPLIDTAPAYGDAEARLGCIFAKLRGSLPGICSKLPSLTGVDKDNVEVSMRASIGASLNDLQISKLDILMFHNFDDILRFNGYLLDVLQEIKLEGLCGSIGVSVYTPEHAIRAMLDKRITHIQIPFNYLDQRWLSEEFLRAIVDRPDIVIHVRSVFLQGLLLNEHDQWPSWYSASAKICCEIDNLIKDFERIDRMDFCLAYVSSFPWIKYIVVGVESPNQFKKILSHWNLKKLTQSQVEQIRSSFQNVPERLIDPSRW